GAEASGAEASGVFTPLGPTEGGGPESPAADRGGATCTRGGARLPAAAAGTRARAGGEPPQGARRPQAHGSPARDRREARDHGAGRRALLLRLAQEEAASDVLDAGPDRGAGAWGAGDHRQADPCGAGAGAGSARRGGGGPDRRPSGDPVLQPRQWGDLRLRLGIELGRLKGIRGCDGRARLAARFRWACASRIAALGGAHGDPTFEATRNLS